MKQKLYNIPVDKTGEIEYLNDSVRRFVKEVFVKDSIGSIKYNKDKNLHYKIIKELYDVGRFCGKVPWNFNQFKNLIYGGFSDNGLSPNIYNYTYCVKEKPQSYKTAWLRRRYSRHLTKSAFQKREHHKKKTLCEKEISRRDWRKKKKFKEDKRRRSWNHGSSSKVFYKNLDARQRRAWERKMIKSERYDKMFHHKDQFVSSWDIY